MFSMSAQYKYLALAIHGQYLFEIRPFTQSSLIPLDLSHITNIIKLMKGKIRCNKTNAKNQIFDKSE